MKGFKKTDIKDIDLSTNYFHYTNVRNLSSIFQKGLEPKIGKNSKGIEKTKKVFFCIGDEGVLTLMDVWIRWLALRPKNDFVYYTGGYLMSSPYFPKFIYNYILNNWIGKWAENEKRIENACYKLERILKESVFLVLKLEKGIDFDYNDIDEVKIQNYSKKHLKYFYSKNSIKNKKVEDWNMHTYSNKVINKNKISIFKTEDTYSANKILKYIASNKNDFVKENCSFLIKYLNLTNKN